MNKTTYRWLLTASWVIGILAVITSIMTENMLPQELRAFLSSQSEIVMTAKQAVWFGVMTVLTLCMVAAYAGLYFLKNWARVLYSICLVGVYAITPLDPSPVINTVWASDAFSMAEILSGVVLAVIYWVPNIRDGFAGQKAQQPSAGDSSTCSDAGLGTPEKLGQNMKLIHTSDDKYYRRWVNLVSSFLLPGSAQFLSGRKAAGIAWFMFIFFLVFLLMGLLIHPKIPYSVLQREPFDWVLFTFGLLIAGDGLRRPIPIIGFRGWGLFLSICLGIAILPALAIRTFFVQPFKVPTSAMQPTIMGIRKDVAGNKTIGDHIFVNKLVYRFSDPQRGNVIVFRTKGIKSLKQDECFVKRLVGLPGETIRIDPPYILVNGSRLTEPTIFRKIAEGQIGYGGYCLAISNTAFTAYLTSPADRITLGPDEYFIMGDNSKNSLDGRYFGPIKRSAIIGKAFYIYAPADRKRKIE